MINITVAVVIRHFYGKLTICSREVLMLEAMESMGQEWSLRMEQGWATWAARQTHWRYRCEVKARGCPVYLSFLTAWLQVTYEWQCY